MVTLFEKLAAKNDPSATDKKGFEAAAAQSSWLGIAFASHPSDADRVAYFKQAAREFQEKR
jgi:Zn-dependent protease with chaperone function